MGQLPAAITNSSTLIWHYYTLERRTQNLKIFVFLKILYSQQLHFSSVFVKYQVFCRFFFFFRFRHSGGVEPIHSRFRPAGCCRGLDSSYSCVVMGRSRVHRTLLLGTECPIALHGNVWGHKRLGYGNYSCISSFSKRRKKQEEIFAAVICYSAHHSMLPVQLMLVCIFFP